MFLWALGHFVLPLCHFPPCSSFVRTFFYIFFISSLLLTFVLFPLPQQTTQTHSFWFLNPLLATAFPLSVCIFLLFFLLSLISALFPHHSRLNRVFLVLGAASFCCCATFPLDPCPYFSSALILFLWAVSFRPCTTVPLDHCSYFLYLSCYHY